MMRRHGWQLPAHTFQVVAIMGFLVLVLAYCIYHAPFLGNVLVEYAALAIYSPVALAVFFLYFRATAIDPADPGVLEKGKARANGNQSKGHGILGASTYSNTTQVGLWRSPPGLFTLSRSSHSENEAEDKAAQWAEEGRHNTSMCFEGERSSSAQVMGSSFCGWLVRDDNCKNDGFQQLQHPVGEEEALYCTLCKVEVRKFSKHCRNCDKCVDGFDHHCRWLNNCIGRKNYTTFVVLMATILLMLVLNWSTGIAVFVRCFVDKRGVDQQILEKLGNGCSRALFAVVVGLCTLVSLLATLPLGELFCFHLILMKKGITTYEYVMAMRAQYEAQEGLVDGDEPSMPASPTSSTTTKFSGSTSSLGLQYRGAWCTPPRVFVEHQDEVLPHLPPGRVPSTVDPDANGPPKKLDGRVERTSVRISAWKLAKLDAYEAAQAAAKARRSSSVLRPIKAHDSSNADTDYTTTVSCSSVSTEFGLGGDGSGGWRAGREAMICPSGDGLRLPFGDSRFVNKSFDTRSSKSCCSILSRMSGMESSVKMSPLPTTPAAPHTLPQIFMGDQPAAQMCIMDAPGGFAYPLPEYCPDAAICDESCDHYPCRSGTPSLDLYVGQSEASKLDCMVRESKRTAVFWSAERGRFRSTMPVKNPRLKVVFDERWPSVGTMTRADVDRGPRAHFVDERIGPIQGCTTMEPSRERWQADDVLYNGTSIFFGGPVCTPMSLQKQKRMVLSGLTCPNAVAHQHVAGSRLGSPDDRSPVFLPNPLHIETSFLE